MFDKIYDLIKKYDNIVIAHHIGVDPDAMASTVGLKNSILLTFPNKKVRLAGSGSNRFSYFGKLDKPEEVKDNTLLIVCDTPDKRRIDGVVDMSKFSDVIKLDHHPFIEKFSDYEYIDTLPDGHPLRGYWYLPFLVFQTYNSTGSPETD